MGRLMPAGKVLILMVCLTLVGCGGSQNSVNSKAEKTQEQLLKSIVNSWSMTDAHPLLPKEETRFEVIWAEMPYVESVYDKGNLRLYLSPANINQDTIFACMINSSNPAYKNIKSWESTDNYDIMHSGNFTVICNKKLISETTFNEIKNGLFTYDYW